MSENVLVLYDLELLSLKPTLQFLNAFFKDKSFTPLSAEIFLSTGLEERDMSILTLHLALDKEIVWHQQISAQAELLGLKQLNPYFSLAEIFDNKMKFYEFMLAEGFQQAKTLCFDFPSENLLMKELSKLDLTKEYLLKPCHGTESIGIEILSFNQNSFLQEDHEGNENAKIGVPLHALEILKTDSLLIQEKQNFKNEYKIVYFDNYLMSAKNLNSNIINYCKSFLDSLINFSAYLSEPLNRVFSIDLLELSENNFMILEANLRPAGIYKFSEFIYVI